MWGPIRSRTCPSIDRNRLHVPLDQGHAGQKRARLVMINPVQRWVSLGQLGSTSVKASQDLIWRAEPSESARAVAPPGHGHSRGLREPEIRSSGIEVEGVLSSATRSTLEWKEITGPRLRWREPGGCKLGSWELSGSMLGWRELVGSRLRSAEHDAQPQMVRRTKLQDTENSGAQWIQT